MKTSCLFFSLCIFISCQRNEKEQLIHQADSLRAIKGLYKFDSSFALDSSHFIAPIPNDDYLVNYSFSSYDEAVNIQDLTATGGIIAYYSRQNPKMYKYLYFRNQNNTIELANEQERYYGRSGDSLEIYLNRSYNFKKSIFFYSVDSIPTKIFIERNRRELVRLEIDAKANNAEICGTAAQEILEKGFPEHITLIDSVKFADIKSRLNTGEK